jgi:hypothetical protein
VTYHVHEFVTGTREIKTGSVGDVTGRDNCISVVGLHPLGNRKTFKISPQGVLIKVFAQKPVLTRTPDRIFPIAASFQLTAWMSAGTF